MFIDPLVDYTRNPKLIEEKISSLPETSEERIAIFSYMSYTYPLVDAEFDKTLIHGFNDLQFIYQNVLQLNTLLGDIIEFPHILNFYSGFFVYNMTKELSRNHKTYSKIVSGEWLPSRCSSDYVKVKDIFIKNLPLVKQSTGKVQKSCVRRQDLKRETVKVVVCEDEPDLDEVLSETDDNTESDSDIDCDSDFVTNRFAILRCK